MKDSDIIPGSSLSDNDENATLHQRGLDEFARQSKAWEDVYREMKLDIQCVTDPLGPWPDSERKERGKLENPRPILHEDILSQYGHQVVNQGQMNPISFDVQSGDGMPMGKGQDDQASKRADELENRIRAMDYESNAEDARLTGLANAVMCGIGVWFLETEDAGGDGFDENIRTRAELDSMSILLDSDSMEPDWGDQNNVFKVWTLSKRAAKQRYGEKLDLASIEVARERAPEWFPGEDKLQFAIWWRREPVKTERVLVDDGGQDGLQMNADELPDGAEDKVTARREKTKYRVFKTVLSGAGVLENIEWADSGESDSQIPCLVTTGPVKFIDGKRVVESLYRKGRTGQLQYDGIISTMWEVIGLTPKPKYAGGVGQFDTSTDFKTIHKNPTGYAEFNLVDERTQQVLAIPRLDTYEPPIQALEMAKQSILIGIQNAIGMSSTERLDRTAKSGKALDSLEQNRNVGTYHFFKSWRMAVEREGRIKVRLIQRLETGPRTVSLRDAKGDNRSIQIDRDYWKGKFNLVVSVGPSYQSQREADSDLAETLLKTHPETFPYVAPSAIMLKGDTPYHRELRDVLIAAAPPAVQAVLRGDQAPDPRAIQAIQQAKQVIDQYKGELQKLTFEKQARVVETQGKVSMDKTRAEFDASVKMAELRLKKYEADLVFKTELMKVNAKLQSDMEAVEADKLIAAESHAFDFDMNQIEHGQGIQSTGIDQQHEVDMTGMQQDHEAGMQDQQLSAAQEAAATAAQNQGDNS